MRRLLRMGLVAVTAMSLSGCYTIAHEVNVMPNITMDGQNGHVIRHFKEEAHFFYLINGLFSTASPPTEESLVAKVRKGGHIANVSITQQESFLDLLLGAVTAGILVSRTVVYEGDVLEGVR